jgi:predicted transcriptional regulator
MSEPHNKEADEAGSQAGERRARIGEPKHLTSARELRAITHPVRLALLEALGLHDALTATEAGELIGESPTTCSFHLRQLAKYGFVTEAGAGPGRRRPWKLAAIDIRLSPADGDPEMNIAAAALERMLVSRWFDRFSKWEVARSHYPVEWQRSAIGIESLLHLTPGELEELKSGFVALLEPFVPRNLDPSLRPAESRPVEVLTFAYPFVGGAG